MSTSAESLEEVHLRDMSGEGKREQQALMRGKSIKQKLAGVYKFMRRSLGSPLQHRKKRCLQLGAALLRVRECWSSYPSCLW